MNWFKRLTRTWRHSHAVPSCCQDPACTPGRRLWRRLCWRRGRIELQGAWYCAPQCFERAVNQHLSRAAVAVPPRRPQYRIPLGLLLLSRGQLTNRQLRAALDEQHASGCVLIGQCLQKLGYVTEQQITAALAAQWRCPLLPVKTAGTDCHLLPTRLLEAFRMLPVQFVATTRVFHLAFSEGVDYGALYAVEQMLNCRTEPCVISQTAMNEALARLADKPRSKDILFENRRDWREMARITCGYVLKLGAEYVRIVACGEFLWVRLSAGHEIANLLFHLRMTVWDGEEPFHEPQRFAG